MEAPGPAHPAAVASTIWALAKLRETLPKETKWTPMDSDGPMLSDQMVGLFQIV